MGKIFITSDTYFGRENMLKHKKRNYTSVQEMNESMIIKWNNKVSKNDTVYHLGNFGWDPFNTNLVLQRLNGNIIFLKGNLDKALIESVPLYDNCSIEESRIIELYKEKVVLCYYPMLYWDGKEDNILHLHGCDKELYPTDSKHNRINASCDNWNESPIELNVIKDLLEEFKNIK